jgi:carboxypeptidase Taq
VTVETASQPLERLRGLLAEIADLRHAEAILGWDSRVSMPRGGASARAQAAATVERLRHERFVSGELGDLLEELTPVEQELDPDSVDAALIRVTRRDWERKRRVPGDLVEEMRRRDGIAVAAWDVAKTASDFAAFAPHLERQLELKHRYLECFPPSGAPYDVLLEDYEEGTTTAKVTSVFDEVKRAVVPLIEAARDEHARIPTLRGPFPIAGQKEATRRVLAAFGADAESWRVDETPHPFAGKAGAGDIRLTTVYEQDTLVSLFATMHEFGHGIYELCIDPSLARTPLDTGTSGAVHESQSRTWENLVGRSGGFWRWFFPELQSIFPDGLRGIDCDSFVRSVNAVRPGPVRGDADEVTYGLHIILRFELEQELLAGAVPVRDLPDIWNARIREYLGVDVPDDAHGVLQDMHWAIGLFGYFPTYLLGNVMSLQIWERLGADLGDVEEHFARGEFASVREWLTEHVYRHGRTFQPRDLLQRVTGSDIDPGPYLAYLRSKFA